MSEQKGEMTVKKYGGHDSLYIDGKCWCSGVSKEISHRIALCWNSHDKLTEHRDKLLAACKLIEKRLLTHGEWDDGCFYYAGHSASELEEPLGKLKAAIAGK